MYGIFHETNISRNGIGDDIHKVCRKILQDIEVVEFVHKVSENS